MKDMTRVGTEGKYGEGFHLHETCESVNELFEIGRIANYSLCSISFVHGEEEIDRQTDRQAGEFF